MQEINLKYRTWFKGIPPKPTKLEIPGWAGEKNRDAGQPWHCLPFTQGATYGVELVYPFDTECTVSTKNGELVFDGDFSAESSAIGQKWERPFSSFAPGHFGFTSSIDIMTEPGYGIMLLPHTRFYTDRTGTVPLAVSGIIESDFWPRVFFVVFKSPLEGQSCIFRKGEGYAKVIVVPKAAKYNVEKMTPEEIKKRMEMEQILNDHPTEIATHTWKTLKGEQFDNKYKNLSKVAKSGGPEAVYSHLKDVDEGVDGLKKDKQERARLKFKRKMVRRTKDV